MAIDSEAMRSTLIEAGLVDPASGQFAHAPNFGGPSESGLRNDPLPADEGEHEAPREEANPQTQERPVEEAARTNEPGAAQNGGAGEPVGAQEAARLGNDNDPIRVAYETQVGQMRQQAQMAFLVGQTAVNEQGERLYTDEQLAQNISRELQYAEQQAFLAGVMQRMQPVAQRAAAEKIAKEHGVDVADIANEASPLAMQTRARTIAELKRDGRFQERKTAGTDTAEGSRGFSSAIPEAIDKLSPQQKMYVGFARGDH